MFDLDGTLIDSRRDIATAVNLLRKDFGLKPLSVKTIAGYVGDGIDKLVERALQGHPADLARATRTCEAYYHRHMADRTKLYPGVSTGLRRLRRAGYCFAVISNKPAAACRGILRHLGVDTMFCSVIGGGDTRHLKPHPNPLHVVMRRLRARRDRTWMIGDHRTDLEAARRAGVRSAFLTYGMGVRHTERPTRTFHTFRDLVAFFLRRMDLP